MSERIKAIYRANAEIKYMFISGLAEVSCVAVTGQSIGDVQAVCAANVGFGMGKSGCAVVQDQADIIILDDNFVSIFNAVRWGRNVFDNCRKFIQFQMTVNLSCLWIVIIGASSLGLSPFGILQLLWINLVMDVLAAIALASEAPHPTELRKERVNLKKDPLISQIMWRSILAQVVYQILAMTVLLYAAPAMFGIQYNLVETPLYTNKTDGPTFRLQHYTFLFQAFMMMNLFNLINCRVLGSENDPEYNIFKNIYHNWWFLVVLLIEFNVQFLLVQGYLGLGVIFTTTPMTGAMHFTALGLGFGSLLVAAAAKATPFKWTASMPVIKEVQDENSFTKKLENNLSKNFKTYE